MSTTSAPLLTHLTELRKRIIYSAICIALTTAIAFHFYEPIATLFMAPFNTMLPNDASMNVHNIYEGFFVKFKLSFIAGAIMALPYVLFQICRFIFPGLTKTEKKWASIALVASSVLSIFSTYMGYVIVFPTVIKFLTSNAFIPNNIQILLNFNQNLSYIITFLFGGIIMFQTPIILTVCLAKNIVSRQFLLTNARWFIVSIVIISAIVTPPDIISQLSLALPLILCYYLCILMAKLLRWGTS